MIPLSNPLYRASGSRARLPAVARQPPRTQVERPQAGAGAHPLPPAPGLRRWRARSAEGVVVAPKNGYKPTHDEIEGVTNLEVMCLMKSLKSRNFVTESFSWLVHYWYLTNEGIEYLREFLHIPENVVPNTLKKVRPHSSASLAI